MKKDLKSYDVPRKHQQPNLTAVEGGNAVTTRQKLVPLPIFSKENHRRPTTEGRETPTPTFLRTNLPEICPTSNVSIVERIVRIKYSHAHNMWIVSYFIVVWPLVTQGYEILFTRYRKRTTPGVNRM